MESSQKHRENHQIPSDILDDLASRFIINVPVAERSDFIRICFQIELAHWFYLDFYCSVDEDKLIPCGIKQFAYHIFQHIPFLSLHVDRLNDIMNEFKMYKMSVPTYGAILMSIDLTRVLLVQSYWAKSSWGFPKGKVNEDEEPLHCAIREVYEETGYDISKLIQPSEFIEGVINYQYTRLYIVQNVPMETVFVPRTRKEIKCCEWFSIEYLPTHKMDTVCKSNLGINANSFFMIMPFVKRLKRWLHDKQQSNELTSVCPQASQAKKGRKNNGYNAINSNTNKKRQRHKSMGDLEGIKESPTTTINILQNQPSGKCLTNNLTKREKLKPTSKRQLFTSESSDSMPLPDTSSSQCFVAHNLSQCSIQNSSGKQLKSNQGQKNNSKNKKKPIISIQDFINSDTNIAKWKNFSFSKERIINVI